MIRVELSNRQERHPVDRRRLISAAKAVLRGEGWRDAEISLAVVDDPTIHELNRRYLQHDYATDVLSFLLSDDEATLEGEVIVSADMAATMATRFEWTAADELLLYVVHGTLHLTGYDDQTPEDQAEMRALEAKYLAELGVQRRG